MNKKLKLSIIIINYNTKDLLLACLASLECSLRALDDWEIIIVDNASTDGSIEELRGQKLIRERPDKSQNLRIIQNFKNFGFAAGNNVGIKQAVGDYILLLNSDTEVRENAIRVMLKFMEQHPKAGVATGKLILPVGRLDPACHRGFPTPWAALTYFLGLEKIFPNSRLFSQYHLGYKNLSESHEIDSPSGAFFLIRKKVIDEIGLLDEDYFIYGEDLDWAYRAKLAGWQIWFNPEAVILHRKKQSGREAADLKLRKETQKYFYQTMQIFYKKHYRRKYPKFLSWLIIALLKLCLIYEDWH